MVRPCIAKVKPSPYVLKHKWKIFTDWCPRGFRYSLISSLASGRICDLYMFYSGFVFAKQFCSCKKKNGGDVDEAHCCDTSRSLRILIGWHSKATSSKQGCKNLHLWSNSCTDQMCEYSYQLNLLLLLVPCNTPGMLLSTEYSHSKEPNMRWQIHTERERRDQTSLYYSEKNNNLIGKFLTTLVATAVVVAVNVILLATTLIPSPLLLRSILIICGKFTETRWKSIASWRRELISSFYPISFVLCSVVTLWRWTRLTRYPCLIIILLSPQCTPLYYHHQIPSFMLRHPLQRGYHRWQGELFLQPVRYIFPCTSPWDTRLFSGVCYHDMFTKSDPTG